jgi:hypothetical protein
VHEQRYIPAIQRRIVKIFKKKGDGMYGLFNIPCSVKASEKKEYRNYMCTLCDSLHEDYGVKGRLLTNYDSTTLAIVLET